VAELTGAQSRLIDEAGAASAGSASLSDIQHVVFGYPLPTSNAMPSQETSPKRPPVP
jgi:hypothetical protein